MANIAALDTLRTRALKDTSRYGLAAGATSPHLAVTRSDGARVSYLAERWNLVLSAAAGGTIWFAPDGHQDGRAN